MCRLVQALGFFALASLDRCPSVPQHCSAADTTSAILPFFSPVMTYALSLSK